VWWYTLVIPGTGRRTKFQGWPLAKTQDFIQRINKVQKSWAVTQVVEHLPSKHQALSSNLSTTEKREGEGHTCNPSYSECNDQEDWGSKPALANSSQDTVTKKSWWSGSRFKLWVQTPVPPKKRNPQTVNQGLAQMDNSTISYRGKEGSSEKTGSCRHFDFGFLAYKTG
jgi:hypothetical protein